MDASEDSSLDLRQRVALALLLGTNFAVLCWVNFVYAPYPRDNDLQFAGWMARHLSWDRLASLSNPAYPLGYPVLLRLLTPVCGSVLNAAFFIQCCASTVVAGAVFLLGWNFTRNFQAAVLGSVAMVAVSCRVSTSEFIDSTSTACVLVGMWWWLRNPERARASFWFGVSVGVAYLFRGHYAAWLVLVPLHLWWFRPNTPPARSLAEAALGFTLGALPILAINTLVHGNPFYVGVLPAMVGQYAVNEDLDWYRYVETYNLWPVSRILAERPAALAELFTYNAEELLCRPSIQVGVAALLALLGLGTPRHRRLTLVLGASSLIYLVGSVFLTRVTSRAILPVQALLCACLFPALFMGLAAARLERFRLLAAVLVVGFLAARNDPELAIKRLELQENRQLLTFLKEQGVRVDQEVFSSSLNIYRLDDPWMLPLRGFGTYMMLDDHYVRARPLPQLTHPGDWQEFFDGNGVTAVIEKLEPLGNQRAPLLREALESGPWSEAYRDRRRRVLLRAARSTRRPEALPLVRPP